MSSLPVAAVLATWLDAVRAGRAGPDDLADAVRGDDPRHLVSGLPVRRRGRSAGRGAAVLASCRRGRGPALALPAPGDPVGLGGPPEFNFAALEAGEAVVVGRVGLVPLEVDARTVVWRAYPADPVPWVDERETAIELRTTLTRGHPAPRRPRRRLVAARDPRPADEPAQPAAAAPAARVSTPAASRRWSGPCPALEIVDLARPGDGGAVTAYEMERRRAALADLDRAARRALVGACSGHPA